MRGGGNKADYAALERAEWKVYKALPWQNRKACGTATNSSNKLDWKIRVWSAPWVTYFETLDTDGQVVRAKKWMRALWVRFPDMHPHCRFRYGMTTRNRALYEKVSGFLFSNLPPIHPTHFGNHLGVHQLDPSHSWQPRPHSKESRLW